jgi:succinate-semialdehyde dehydrogenase/glutarate-semialdehyde dehydrogenase
MTYQSFNPTTGKLLKKFDELTEAQLEAKLAKANECFAKWKKTSYAERAKIIAKAGTLLQDRVEDLAKTMTLEMGKRIEEARGEVEFSAKIMAYYAKNAEAFLADTKLNPEQGDGHMESSPIGVIFCVEPWNFPYYQLARVAGPHLMAGNALVIKQAGIIPQCAIAFEKIMTDAGAPDGLYTNLMISHEQSETVIDDPRIKGVALTGSVAAGRSIAGRAAKALKPTSMELGGADVFIVLEDADMDHALKWAVWGRMYNAGQTCVASKRFIIVESVANQFMTGFKAAFGALEAGDPLDEKTTLGPLSTEQALVDLLKQVDVAVQNGATVVTGGKRLNRAGSYMQPTILTDIKPDNPAFRDEFFGPVAMVFRVKDEVAAIALANDSDFGLGGAVFTGDLEAGKRVASAVETGMMFINNLDWLDADLPFGGVKNSGYGRELGDMGIHQFVNKKLVRYLKADAPV